MKIHASAAYILCIISLVILSGCGSDNGQAASSVVAASQGCIGCHQSNSLSVSPVTGERITDEWQRSIHSTANGAGCSDCHARLHTFLDCSVCHTQIHKTHGNSCGQCHGGSTNLTDCRSCHATVHSGPNKQCLDCHSGLGSPHFSSNISGTGHDAQFVDPLNTTTCKNCHNPHDNTVLPEAKAWATSAHGDVKGPAWTYYDFKARVDCLRCHTSAGFASYVTGTPAFVPPTAPLAASPTYGVLGCNGCHKNYNFRNHTSVRKTPAYLAPYNKGASSKQYPAVGDSNLCIACHSGRESGDSVLAITSDMSNTGFVNSHYMAAAGTMYLANAFVNFTTLTAPVATNNELNADGTKAAFASTKSYARNNLPDNVSVPGYGIPGGATSTHRKLGTLAIRGDSHNPSFFVPGALDSGGPCVACHMTAGHGLKLDEGMAQKVCLNCHNDNWLLGGDGAGNALYYASQTAEDLKKYRIEPQSEAYQNGLDLLKQLLLVKYMVKFDHTAHPYFYDMQKDPAGKTAVRDWTRKNVAGVTDAAVAAFGSPTITPVPAGGLSQMQAKRLMGACFNFNLMVREPYMFIHARTFSQRLVYDTLDYLDNNTMDFTSLTSARKLNPAHYHGTNVNVRASDGTLASETMIWLSGTHFNDPGAIPGAGTFLKPMKLHP